VLVQLKVTVLVQLKVTVFNKEKTRRIEHS
jgi:hypothetical protein